MSSFTTHARSVKSDRFATKTTTRLDAYPSDIAWWSQNSPNNALAADESGPLPRPTPRPAPRPRPTPVPAGKPSKVVSMPTREQVREFIDDDLNGPCTSSHYADRDCYAAAYSEGYRRRFGR